MLTLIVLVLFPFVIWQSYKQLQMAKASSSWPTVPGSVTASERTKVAWRTQPRVSFSYEVNGKAYSSSRVTVVGAVPVSETEAILGRYRLHQPVTVHYQPDDPALAVLETGPNAYAAKNFRNLIVIFVAIIVMNVLYVGVTMWSAARDAESTKAPTYDDVTKADPGLGDRLIREDAEKGNAKDQGYVAFWYLTGSEGYTKDPVEGAKWLRKAADQGDADAENRLGQLYAAGTGVEKDLVQAVEWLKKAAAQGEPHACVSLGYASEKGLGGMPQDTQAAIEWYRKAGDESHAKAALKRLGAE